MQEQSTIVDEILQMNDIMKARNLLNNYVREEQKASVLAQIQNVIMKPDQIVLRTGQNYLYHLQLLQETFSLLRVFNGNSFKCRNIFHLIAAAKGSLTSAIEKEKIRSAFVKNLLKDASFWGLQRLQAFKDNLVDSSNGYRAQLQTSWQNQEIQKIGYLLNFYEDKSSFFPPTFQVRDYFFKYMLMLRGESSREKGLYQRLERVLASSNYHKQIVARNFRYCLYFFRSSYNDKEYLYYPYKNIISLLNNYKNYQVQGFIINSSLGLQWDYEELSCCLINCIKVAGITENSSRIIKSFIQLAKNHKKIEEIIKVFEKNIPKLFIFIKHTKLFPTTHDLLCEFILGPPPSIGLYNAFFDKAKTAIKSINAENHSQFVNLLDVVRFKYQESTDVSELDSVIQNQVKNRYVRLDPQTIKKKLNEYDWRIFDLKPNQNNVNVPSPQEKPAYKGLVNIGNSCYMNSFLQSLFMTKEFRKEIIGTSTLQLEKQALARLHKQYQGDQKVQISTLAREHVRPLAQLQRLFCLLLKSKRLSINPSSFKNSGPSDFRNTYQQDSSQYGRSLFDLLSQSSFPNFFEGQMTTEIQCPRCQVKRTRKQEFVDLMLNSQTDEEKLQTMIDNSFHEEAIENLTCDHCNQVSEKSVKRHWISQLPNYLILTIKRFEYNVQEKKNKKKQFKVQIEENFRIGQELYQLYAIVVHRGPSANSGHYYTFSRQLIGKQSKWLCFNDSQVDYLTGFERVKEFLDNCPEDTPYILFGQKTNHVIPFQKELEQPLLLRKPLQQFIEKDNIQYIKEKEKKPLVNFNLFNNLKLGNFKKYDEDDEDGPSGFKDFSSPIF